MHGPQAKENRDRLAKEYYRYYYATERGIHINAVPTLHFDYMYLLPKPAGNAPVYALDSEEHLQQIQVAKDAMQAIRRILNTQVRGTYFVYVFLY